MNQLFSVIILSFGCWTSQVCLAQDPPITVEDPATIDTGCYEITEKHCKNLVGAGAAGCGVFDCEARWVAGNQVWICSENSSKITRNLTVPKDVVIHNGFGKKGVQQNGIIYCSRILACDCDQAAGALNKCRVYGEGGENVDPETKKILSGDSCEVKVGDPGYVAPPAPVVTNGNLP